MSGNPASGPLEIEVEHAVCPVMLTSATSTVAPACTRVSTLPQSSANVLRLLLVTLLLLRCTLSYAENIKAERRRAEQILDLVSRDVQSNFYDDNLKGLDWPALLEQARERIRSADELGQMYGAISALLYQLHDSHTVFIPPKRKIKAVYGFKAKPFGNNILVYEVSKDGPAAKAGLQLGDQIMGVDRKST